MLLSFPLNLEETMSPMYLMKNEIIHAFCKKEMCRGTQTEGGRKDLKYSIRSEILK